MKSVAIIGAGPAGLVAAKTFLHSYPKGTFSVAIFEAGKNVGGLWAIESNPNGGMIHPDMRTNLSQFTVCFSDLAWDSVELPTPANIYPKAWQVNRYLEHYARKFIPDRTITFETRVKAVERDEDEKWRVTVVGTESNVEEIKDFDYLITATGFFSEPKPINFELDGVDVLCPLLHSSRFRTLRDIFPAGQQPSRGKVLVVGGSHSGGEIAGTIAMQMSNASYSPSGSGTKPLQVVHVMPNSLVSIPVVVQTGKGDSPTFLPLDTMLFTLSSRTEDPISFSYSHGSQETATTRRAILSTLMNGANGNKVDSDAGVDETNDFASPYAVVGDKYVDFVRSDAIKPVLGKLTYLGSQESKNMEKTRFMRAKVRQSSGELELEDIVAVVYATGFSNSRQLEFMPKNILHTLDYDAAYPRLPLLLSRDCLTSSNAAPRNLAVMGSFDGLYWGILESQARMIAKKFALDGELPSSGDSDPDEKSTKLLNYMKELRSTMDSEPSKVPQNFFGDYIGIQEETSRELGLRRVDLDWGEREGMISPTRYVDERCDAAEAEKMMKKLQNIMDTSSHPRAFSATATFRALHGVWKAKRTERKLAPVFLSIESAGFLPRNPTDSRFDEEYLVVMRKERDDLTILVAHFEKFVYRLNESENNIEIWSVSEGVKADKLLSTLDFNKATSDQKGTLKVDTTVKTFVYTFVFAGIHIEEFIVGRYADDEHLDRDSKLEFRRS